MMFQKRRRLNVSRNCLKTSSFASSLDTARTLALENLSAQVSFPRSKGILSGMQIVG